MTLRKSFWKVDGLPNQNHEEWQPFIERYCPEGMTGDDEQIHDAWYGYVAEKYPELSVQDARLHHLRDVKLTGDLSFRDAELNEVSDETLIDICDEFRQSCRWWIVGTRASHVALEDAKDFKESVGRLLKDATGSEKTTLRAEIELSCQFADAIEQATQIAPNNVMDLDDVKRKRRDMFQQSLDEVFASPNV